MWNIEEKSECSVGIFEYNSLMQNECAWFLIIKHSSVKIKGRKQSKGKKKSSSNGLCLKWNAL